MGAPITGIQVSDSVSALAILNTDGSIDWYENRVGEGWVLKRIQSISATQDHKHSDLSVKIKTESGTMTFENGILTRFKED
jgi:uncharacterized protein YigE (DUF2233 family)